MNDSTCPPLAGLKSKSRQMKRHHHIWFYVLVLSLFLVNISEKLFSRGMFVDGLDYATIARNMAEGAGTFWKPHLSKLLYNEFYEHPPLALGIQSLAYRIFGDHLLVERFYSLFTFLLTGFLMILIWKKITGKWHYAWLPLLLWFIIPEVLWAAANNMLENTMMVFIYLSFLLYLHSRDKHRFLLLSLSGIALSAAVLTKGFTCLYLWPAPLFFWLFKRKRSFPAMVSDSLVLIVTTILPLLLLYLFLPEARHNMISYFNRQLVGSLENIQTVNSRFAIIALFLQNIIIPLAIVLIIMLLAKLRKINRTLLQKNINTSALFLTIALAGVLPVMISLKQRGFYILTVYPLVSLALAYYIYPVFIRLIRPWLSSSIALKVIRIISIILLASSILISILSIGKTGRDHALIHDTELIIKVVGEGSTVSICPALYTNWSLHGYFARYGKVNLDARKKHLHTYYISDGCAQEILRENYNQLDIDTRKYRLYRKKAVSD